ncbi:MAG: ATP-binding cassette domain-containing protein [Microcella sp.]|uniref:ATP-binding cassette domain-containing protein n=1 Tax=Microcella sp. TaxID=1913979 RepID=UPI0024CA8351|nr:ATP-binding cassette domain-containing protein [Microcella sp.]UYN82984.1 MAG: ATP-binding cassette domain-containing protein [Microcella sp.]
MSAAMLEIDRASVTYRGGAGIAEVSLRVDAGEIHALVGLNGAGKSTLMSATLGMVPFSSGTICIGGRGIDHGVDWGAVGHYVGRPFAYPDHTVEGTLRVAAELADAPAGAVDDVIAELALEPMRAKRVSALSSGNRQRTGIAAALLAAPRLLVLDEPTNALDPAATIALRGSLRDRAAAGAAVLVSSHHLDEVARVAHRITVIHRGGIVGELDPGGADLERAFFSLVAQIDGVTW